MSSRFDIPFAARCCELTIVVILGLTGILKLWTAFTSAKILELSDPILLVSNRLVALILGAIELLIADYVFRSVNISIKLSVMLWLILCFAVYRLGWWLSDVPSPCPCLGTGYEWWPWLNTQLPIVSTIIFCILAAVVFLRLLAQVVVGQNTKIKTYDNTTNKIES